MDFQEKKYFFGAKGKAFENARYLRNVSTDAEQELWQHIRNRKLKGMKFRRQYTLGHFIVDFYCPIHNLVIEVDGGVHDEPEVKEYDIGRTYEIEKLGIRMIRFRNEEVMHNIESVLQRISDAVEGGIHPSPDMERGRG